jgi:hypothetical protein
MPNEKWLWRTYGEGIRDALKKEPGRNFRLIHRFHQTSLSSIKDAFREYPGPIDLQPEICDCSYVCHH